MTEPTDVAAPTGELAFADGLGSLARSIQQNLGDEVHSLDFIVSAAVELIPGVESAAVSTLAGKNRLAGQLYDGTSRLRTVAGETVSLLVPVEFILNKRK